MPNIISSFGSYITNFTGCFPIFRPLAVLTACPPKGDHCGYSYSYSRIFLQRTQSKDVSSVAFMLCFIMIITQHFPRSFLWMASTHHGVNHHKLNTVETWTTKMLPVIHMRLQRDAVLFPLFSKVAGWECHVDMSALYCWGYIRLSHGHDEVLKLFPDLQSFIFKPPAFAFAYTLTRAQMMCMCLTLSVVASGKE